MSWQAGDRLWVRETVRGDENADGYDGVRYVADDVWLPIENSQESGDRWVDLYNYRGKRGAVVPPIYMPRWASRLTLIVEGVKVERLQEISEEDARDEGIEWREGGAWGIWNADGTMRCGGSDDPREAFRCLWVNINGNGSWDANPWVAAISFRVERRNIDNGNSMTTIATPAAAAILGLSQATVQG